MKQDITEEIIKNWQKECPEFDVSAKEVMGRIIRLQEHYLHDAEEILKPLGLKKGSYSILSTLRVSGKPYELHPKELHHFSLVTSGGMSNLLNHMEKDELISRHQDPEDQRSVRIRLTKKGKQLAEEGMAELTKLEHKFTSPLSKKEQQDLAKLLQKMLMNLQNT
jgi:DNA-binding MarR family transcriptional regulator